MDGDFLVSLEGSCSANLITRALFVAMSSNLVYNQLSFKVLERNNMYLWAWDQIYIGSHIVIVEWTGGVIWRKDYLKMLLRVPDSSYTLLRLMTNQLCLLFPEGLLGWNTDFLGEERAVSFTKTNSNSTKLCKASQGCAPVGRRKPGSQGKRGFYSLFFKNTRSLICLLAVFCLEHHQIWGQE